MQFRICSVLSLFEMICPHCFFWEWLRARGRQKSGWRVAYRLVIDPDVVIQPKDNENIFPKAEWGNIMVTWDLQKSEQFWLPEKKFYDLQNWEKHIILWILPHCFFSFWAFVKISQRQCYLVHSIWSHSLPSGSFSLPQSPWDTF